MEVFMTRISMTATQSQIIAEIAKVVHGPSFAQFNQDGLLNFAVHLHRPKKVRQVMTSYRTGVVTFPTEVIGRRFLDLCGGAAPRVSIVAGYPIALKESTKSARRDVVEKIRRLPFDDPRELQKREKRSETLGASAVSLSEIQFGWEGRDEVFSVEYKTKTPSTVHFSSETREFEISLAGGDSPYGQENIVISFSQIRRASASRSSDQVSLYFSLYHAPKFELVPPSPPLPGELIDLHALLSGLFRDEPPKRKRMTSLQDESHRRVAPFTSVAIRLICGPSEYGHFVELWEIAQANLPLLEDDYRAEHRELFSSTNLAQINHWMEHLDWPVAFYVDALVRNGIMDPTELLTIRPEIDRLLLNEGNEYSSGFLHFYRLQLEMLWFSEGTQSQETIEDCFWRCRREYKHLPLTVADDLFHCLHVTVTPTGMILTGPFPDQTNRVLRNYPEKKDRFLRVSFVDENNLHFRFDSTVDGRAFIDSHVGGILRTGLTVGGRRFDFLHYSQSALKDHAVWFVCPFYDSASQSIVDAETIITSLGTFSDLKYDSRLIYCPARYAARISQAFTTTDSSITIEANEISIEDDIKSETGSCFTDGVGTVSPILADEMWKLLCYKKRRGFRPDRPRPRAFQIRFQGSKGMISVDHTLKGREVILRPSMIKFEAKSHKIEIAGVFNRPGKMYLNRPLIMLLEGLGVPGSIFLDLQRRAVERAMTATKSLATTATMLESYGLGQSFRLPSVFHSLASLDPDCMPTDTFFCKGMQNAIFHVLRDFKHKARIPVLGWTLVGVADVHSYLEEGEVFVCIEEEKGVKKYLNGMVCISRSPTIHPGDVQLARAIGPPASGSPFSQEQLQNTLVFSTKGVRSLPSCLGGGDLDGDVYNITDYGDLFPRQTCEPASYDAAPRKELARPSRKEDVIDFIVDYINADNVGMIATNWLIIADQSELGIHDPDCLTLAKLHSDAVDYPKSGNSVPMQMVPKLHRRDRPDWIEPETGQPSARTEYYPSERAIGHLYRNIDLSKASLRDLFESRDQLNDQNFPKLQDSLCQTIMSEVMATSKVLEITRDEAVHLDNLFRMYSDQLRNICSSFSMSNARHSRLTEAEAFIGTIKARTSQPKKRADLTAKLREHTAQLVTDVRFELAGGDSSTWLDRLRLAWASWRMSLEKMETSVFGAPSFFWVALGVLFDTLKSIEEGSICVEMVE